MHIDFLDEEKARSEPAMKRIFRYDARSLDSCESIQQGKPELGSEDSVAHGTSDRDNPPERISWIRYSISSTIHTICPNAYVYIGNYVPVWVRR